MKFSNRSLAGMLLSIGGLQWFFSIVIAEGIHLGFNIGPSEWMPFSSNIHYLSDLGVGSTALLFNGSLFIMGLMVAIASYLPKNEFSSGIFSIFLLITGIGSMGVALFPTNVQPIHGIFQAIAMLFGAFSAIITLKLERTLFSCISFLLGAFSLIATVVFFPYLGLGVNDTITYLELGKGAMERLAIYTLLMWVIGLGFYSLEHEK